MLFALSLPSSCKLDFKLTGQTLVSENWAVLSFSSLSKGIIIYQTANSWQGA